MWVPLTHGKLRNMALQAMNMKTAICMEAKVSIVAIMAHNRVTTTRTMNTMRHRISISPAIAGMFVANGAIL